MEGLEFERLSLALLARGEELLTHWLPSGKLQGTEFSCGSLNGDAGKSLKVNIKTGKWADFATEEKGGDLISLYAAKERITQGESFKRLSDHIGFQTSETPKKSDLVIPPKGQEVPHNLHPKLGKPKHVWCYREPEGNPMFYVARYDTANGKKEFLPWSWSSSKNDFIAKAWPGPNRPLYGLDLLTRRPNDPVLVVEGEKACEAAREICGEKYVCVTWPNGASAHNKTDWQSVSGRKILIWPDADPHGIKAGEAIAERLLDSCPEVKLIAPGKCPVKGWDAADALRSGWTWEDFLAWAKPKVKLIKIAELQVMPPEPLNGEDQDPVQLSHMRLWTQLGLAVSERGPITNILNVRKVLQGLPEFSESIWFDTFHQKIFRKSSDVERREWNDIDTLRLTEYLQENVGIPRISDETVFKGVTSYAHLNLKNEPKDWFESIIWDGEARIERFFRDYLGASENIAYQSNASKNWWISMIARIYKPGCKVDNMVILHGGQGAYKSTALAAIGRSWFTEAHEPPTSKDFYMILQGKLIVEISEMDSFNRAEANKVKQVISCPVDRYRAPYARCPQDIPRQSIFVGTTNDDQFLKDPTGARRFWPITIGTIRVDKINADREQLFAEAVHCYKAGENWWIMPDSETIQVQETKRQIDEWESDIADYIVGLDLVGVKAVDVAKHVLNLELRDITPINQNRIYRCLRSLGWRTGVKKDPNTKKVVRVWRPKSLSLHTFIENNSKV